MWMMNSRFAYHLNHIKKENPGKNVKAAILPESEETISVSSEYHSMTLETKQSDTFKEQSVVSPDNITSYSHNKEKNDFSYRSSIPKSVTPYIIIGILSLVIVIGGISFVSYVRKNQNSSPAEPGQNQFSENSVEVPVMEETLAPVLAVSQKDSVILSTGTGTSSEKVYSDFYQILQSSDAPGGYLYDIDHDGKEDMILKDTMEMDFVLYTHDSSGNLSMTHFGDFLAWGDDDFYDVTGTDGIHYIYYFDEYMQRTVQGYFNPQTGNELDFSDGYSEEEIQNQLSRAGFQVNGGNYSKLEMLYYDVLCQKTAPVQTIPATEKRNPPEIKGEIKKESAYDGSNYMLYVSGNYDYYYVECRQYGYNDTTGQLILSENAYEASLCLTNGYDIAGMTASVTPYYEDGTKGKTITCSFKQPEQKTTAVAMPSNASYLGTGTPISDDGFLNLRSSKSISSGSNIITKIYNGDSISVYDIGSSDWVYVQYGSYSGYVKKSYVKMNSSSNDNIWIDGNEAVSVYSCYDTGEISGNGVSGFTTSYVVEGGSKTTVREELGNHWHVTAKHYCYAYGILWYELWDTDDGDYYGWVDESYIQFYSVGFNDWE